MISATDFQMAWQEICTHTHTELEKINTVTGLVT